MIQGDQSLYLSRLTFLQETIDEYYKNDRTSAAIKQQISELQREIVAQKIEYKLSSLELLTELREQRRLQWFNQSATQGER